MKAPHDSPPRPKYERAAELLRDLHQECMRRDNHAGRNAINEVLGIVLLLESRVLEITNAQELLVTPCDVILPPSTIVLKGVKVTTLIRFLKQREAWQQSDLAFNAVTARYVVDGSSTAERADPDAFEKAFERDALPSSVTPKQ